jgi:RHS repeat-associated protein
MLTGQATVTAVRYYAQDDMGNVQGQFPDHTIATETVGDWELPTVTGETTNWLTWKGLSYDPDVGLTYMRSRWYDPNIGRFVREDPLGLAGGINPYTFAENDPTNGSDPSGMDAYISCETIAHASVVDGVPDGGYYYETECSVSGGGGESGNGGIAGGGGGGGGKGGPRQLPTSSRPKPKPKCGGQRAETQLSAGVSALLGGGPIAGAFFGGGVSGGITSSGHIFIQIQGSLTVGVGIYGGYGAGFSGGRSTVTSSGVSTGSEWLGQANAGLFESAGVSVTRDNSGNWGGGASPLVHYGNGFGAEVSGGRLGYTTLATPSFGFIRKLFHNNCQ